MIRKMISIENEIERIDKRFKTIIFDFLFMEDEAIPAKVIN